VSASCSVKGKNTFSVSANVSQGKGTQFQISGGTIDKATGKGTFTAQIFTSDAQGLVSVEPGDCTFDIPANSGDYTIKAGALYANWSCPQMKADSGVDSYCGAYGEIVLEYCED
jgi:hypothetical protein